MYRSRPLDCLIKTLFLVIFATVSLSLRTVTLSARLFLPGRFGQGADCQFLVLIAKSLVPLHSVPSFVLPFSIAPTCVYSDN